MKSSTRIYALIAVMSVLVGLNLWQWSGGEDAGTNSDSGNLIATGDFEVRRSYLPLDEERDVVRDLFAPWVNEPEKASDHSGESDADRKRYQRRAAERELDNFKLAGILTRDNRREGFLISGENSYRVGVGDRAGKRFVVKSISDDAVYLVDPVSKVSGTIRLSGY